MSAESAEKRFVIDGWSYDISSFAKIHPGGSVINFYEGLDASDAYHALHQRSLRADKYLATLPRRPVDKSIDDVDDSELIKDFRILRDELEKDGLYKPLWGVQIYRLIEVLVFHFLSLWVMINYSWVVGGIIYGITVGRNGLLMHDMGHKAFFCNQKLDKIAHSIFFGLGITGSGKYWNNQHNKHHAATQERSHDTDLATLPVVAFDEIVGKQGNASVLQFQWLFFFPAQFLLFHNWKYWHFRHAWRTREWSDVLSIVGHTVLTIYLTWSQGILAWFIYEGIGYALGGFYLATVFSLNHTHRPTVAKFTKRNWVIRSTSTTTNSEPTLFMRWLSGYLCYQIEHHLFPSMPHPQLYYAAPRVKALLKKHGVVYDLRSANTTLKLVVENLFDVGTKIHADALLQDSEKKRQ